MEMGIKEILNILPHKYPMLLIDKVVDITPGVSVKAIKNVTINEDYFNGHFPGEPVMPGVLMVEAMAQAGLVVLLSKEEFKGKLGFFTGVKEAKFRRKVVPGDVLEINVELIKLRSSFGVAKGIITVEGQKACEAEFSFAIG
ncbi:3-hydroxyacyl-ACP dehydratase FabZ [Clostridium cylindrosporum]|uniref:3-hydroxyacyl-[acyl-carrier-protein] dehydratase FabZ n=1 Tax=Clostridium cylindrosporum DSM 605 TaxID=1121307 RepID=A0A0J8DG38_CLOCY|nr:3-hydroxyacyl-ACP dehydratase FabZ [Clostridium cylindrosporum]KMT23133.1 3-hydroxyacyl-[acyl-carrier-protein] dehydratase FabZ [Clostridium cylindrosporum DSM 605]